MKVLVFKDIKNDRWTIWSVDRKKHLGYADELVLRNCEFIVLEEKRKKVVSSGSRFPHAWVKGDVGKRTPALTSQVTYNPFKNKTFMKGKKVLRQAKVAVFNNQGKVFV